MIAQLWSTFIFDRLFLYQVLVSLGTYLIIQGAFFYSRRLKRFNLMREYGIPMEKTSILYGHYHLYMTNPSMFLIDEKFMKKFGKIYGVFIGDEPNIIVTDKELLRKVFIENTSSFKERIRLLIKTPLSSGVLFAEHDRWKVLRNIMIPFFNSYNVQNSSSSQFIENSIKQLLNYIESKRQLAISENRRLEINAHSLMKSVTLHMISEFAVRLPGVQVNEKEKNVESLDSFLDLSAAGIVTYAIKFPFMRYIIEVLANNFEYASTMSSIHQRLNKLMDRGQMQRQNYNLVDDLIKSYRQGKLTRTEFISSIDSVLIAGYDTTSCALTSLIWVLGKNQDIQDKLRSEIGAYGIESEYLMQVIKEVLRLYPPVVAFTTRLATETISIDGFTIPQGTKVVHNTYLMHKHPDLWDEPEKFDPERFGRNKLVHPCAYAPFGLGERKCLGFQLALLELKMIISSIILRYQIITLKPEVLVLKSHAVALAAPLDPVVIEFRNV